MQHKHRGMVLAVCLFCFLPQTLVNEGIKGIYKGISAPLATVALFNAVLFASRGQMEVLLKHIDGKPCGHCQCCCCSGPANPVVAAFYTVHYIVADDLLGG
jgi:hypothetical protein